MLFPLNERVKRRRKKIEKERRKSKPNFYDFISQYAERNPWDIMTFFCFWYGCLVGNCGGDSSANVSVCEWSYFCIRNDNKTVLRLCQVADSGWKASQSSNCFRIFLCWFCHNASSSCSYSVHTQLWWKSYSHQLLMFNFSCPKTHHQKLTSKSYEIFKVSQEKPPFHLIWLIYSKQFSHFVSFCSDKWSKCCCSAVWLFFVDQWNSGNEIHWIAPNAICYVDTAMECTNVVAIAFVTKIG